MAPTTATKKAPVAKKAATHPTFLAMIQEAVKAHPEEARAGVSRPTLKKYLAEKYKIDMSSASNVTNLNNAIKRGSDKGDLVLPKGLGGRVKVAPKKSSAGKENVAPKKTATKAAAPKKTPAAGAAKKAPAAKKAAAPKAKTTTAAAKKPVAKKAAAPAAKKTASGTKKAPAAKAAAAKPAAKKAAAPKKAAAKK